MKISRFLVLLLAMTMMMFISCGDDDDDNNTKVDKCKDVVCEVEGEVCDPGSGECVPLSTGKCNPNPCDTGEYCDPVDGSCSVVNVDDLDSIVKLRKHIQGLSPEDAITGVILSKPVEGVVIALQKAPGDSKYGAVILQADAVLTDGYAGIFLNLSQVSTAVAIGDLVSVKGTLREYFLRSEILPASVEDFEVKSNDVSIPAAIDVASTDINVDDHKKWESMLVNITNVPFSVTVKPDYTTIYDYELANAENRTITVSTYWDATKSINLALGQSITKVTGVLTYSYEVLKLCPRDSSDVGGEVVTNKCTDVVCEVAGEVCDLADGVCKGVETKTLGEIRTAEAGLSTDGFPEGGTYTTTGNVTAILNTGSNMGFFIQDATGGIMVYTKAVAPTVTLGDTVTVTGSVGNYYGLLRFLDDSVISAVAGTVPAATEIAAADLVEVNESMFVKMTNGPFTVVSTNDKGNTTVKDASDNEFLILDSLFAYPLPVDGSTFTTLQGIVTFDWSAYKLLPRNADDMAAVTFDCSAAPCEEYETCTADATCTLTAGRCATTTDCDAPAECNMTTYVCETPAADCTANPCEDYQTCTGIGTDATCVLTPGMCVVLEDCTDDSTSCEANVCTGGTVSLLPGDGGFEMWDAGVLTSWMGTKSTIVAANVAQSTDFKTGMYSVQLSNSTTSHKRFTNKAMDYAAGTYTCTFYAKGTGSVRNSLYYDGNPADTYNNGYSPYTDYTVLAATTEWAPITYTFTLDADAVAAEFIFSVKATDDATPAVLLIDDVTCSVE